MIVQRGIGGNRTRSALSSLKEKCDPDWWKKSFDRIYLITDGDVVMNDQLTRFEVDLITSVIDLEKDDVILDLCCGNGRHSIELARRGYKRVHALDYSSELLEIARRTAYQMRTKVEFKRGDARYLPYEDDTFDAVIIMGNSFGYFSSESDDVKVLQEVRRVLRPYGKILIDVADRRSLIENFESVGVESHDGGIAVIRLRELSRDRSWVYAREIVLEGWKKVLADRVYGMRLYSYDELKSLLEKVGFTNVSLRTRITYDPKDLDPGIMKSRMLITALASKEPRGCSSKQIVVLLGDPRKPNLIKLGKVFDPDSIYAVNELKSALLGIKGYCFTFLDDHEEMVNYLLRNRNSIYMVLNLCDDGFMNDPSMEPHVPALLDLLNIRYTGAGVRCLSICYDKTAVKEIARSLGIPIPWGRLINDVEEFSHVPSEAFPLIIKPNFGDNSWGITERSIANDRSEAVAAYKSLREVWGYRGPVLVERFIEGIDVTTSIIGNPPREVCLPILTEDYSSLPPQLPRILTYEAKWVPDSQYASVKSVPARLPRETRANLLRWSRKLFLRLECRDYARFDWRIDEHGRPWLLEVNPNPGWVWDGHLRKACHFYGWSYKKMLLSIIRAAETRYGLANPLDRSFGYPNG